MTKKVKPIPVKIVHDDPPAVSRYQEPDSMHMSVKAIDNGFIVNEYGWKDGKHYDRSVFTPIKPSISAPIARGATRHEPVKKPPPVPKRTASQPSVSGHARSSLPARNERTFSGFMKVDMKPPPKTVRTKSPLNVPSDAALPQLKRARDNRLSRTKL